MDNYKFKNLFKIMGITVYDNPVYVRAYIKQTIQRLNREKARELRRDAKMETNVDAKKMLFESANHTLSRGILEESNEFEKENDINVLIFELIRLLDELYKMEIEQHPEIAEREEVKATLYAHEKFSTPEDVSSYISNELNLGKYVDFENLDLSENLYNKKGFMRDNAPLFVYNTVPKKKPILLLDKKRQDGDTVRAYVIGTFEYGTNLKDRVKVLKYSKNRIHYFEPYAMSDKFTMFTVVTEDENGNKTQENVMMNTNFSNLSKDIDNDFFAEVVFSRLVIENALENNSGLIGSLKMKDGQPYLTADIDDPEAVTAISYALSNQLTFDSMESERWSNSPDWNWDNPNWIYKEMNEKIRQMEEEKSNKKSGASTFPCAPGDSDEGGR